MKHPRRAQGATTLAGRQELLSPGTQPTAMVAFPWKTAGEGPAGHFQVSSGSSPARGAFSAHPQPRERI